MSNKIKILLCIILSIVVCGSFLLIRDYNQQKQIMIRSVKQIDKKRSNVRDLDVRLMLTVSSNLYDKKYSDGSLTKLRDEFNEYYYLDNQQTNYNKIEKQYNTIVNNAKMKNPNKIIKGDMLSLLHEHYQNQKLINKYSKQIKEKQKVKLNMILKNVYPFK